MTKDEMLDEVKDNMQRYGTTPIQECMRLNATIRELVRARDETTAAREKYIAELTAELEEANKWISDHSQPGDWIV